jgi:hypothetical protein
VAQALSQSPEAARDRAAQRTSVGLTAALLVATFLLTRQTQIPVLEGLAAVWALLLLLLSLRWSPLLPLAIPMLAYGCGSMLVSLLAGREPVVVVRFFVITIGTVLAFQIRPVRISVPWAMLPVTLQAVLIFGIAVALGVLQEPGLAVAVRDFALDSNWGDIYSFDGLYYRVQLIGNALLPLLFMIAVWRWQNGRIYRVLALLSLLGLIAAGNLTYFVVAVIAVLIAQGKRLKQSMFARMVLVVMVLLVLAATWGAINEAVADKFEGSDSSMGVRFDQWEVAHRELGASPIKLLLGAGLGASFPDGKQRNYSQDRYIEMQWLYLLLQLGLLGTLIYVATLWLSVHQRLDKGGRCIFWLYMLSGLTNPYILDTNQIVATLILVCAFPRRTASLKSSASIQHQQRATRATTTTN